MLRLRALDGATARGPHLEALKAATLMHLEAGDYATTPALQAETPPAKAAGKRAKPAPKPLAHPTRERIATAAGVAQGFKLAKLDRAAVVSIDSADTAKSEAAWAEALEYAMRAELALLVLCTDIPGRRRKGALTWEAVSKLSARCALPLVFVDGEDAVAMYRVMQESMIHARLGAGPALVWAHFSDGKLKPSQQPIQRLEAYMRVRKIPLEA